MQSDPGNQTLDFAAPRLEDVEVVSELEYDDLPIFQDGSLVPTRRVDVHIRLFAMKRSMSHVVSAWLRKLYLLAGNVEYLNNAHFIHLGNEFSGMQYGVPHSSTAAGLETIRNANGGTALEFWNRDVPASSFMQRIIRSDDLEPLARVDDGNWRARRLATAMKREAKIRTDRRIDIHGLAAQIVGFEDFNLTEENVTAIPHAAFHRGQPRVTLDIAVIRDLRSVISSRLKFADSMGHPRHMAVTGQIADGLVSGARLGLTHALRAGRISGARFDRHFPEGPHPLAERCLVIHANHWASNPDYRADLAMRLGFTASEGLSLSTSNPSRYGIGRGECSSSFGPAGESEQSERERTRYARDPRMEEIFRMFPRLADVEASMAWI